MTDERLYDWLQDNLILKSLPLLAILKAAHESGLTIKTMEDPECPDFELFQGSLKVAECIQQHPDTIHLFERQHAPSHF